MIKHEGKRYHSIKEAAERFGVQPPAVYRWIKEGLVDKPPQTQKGRRSIYYCPEGWIMKVEAWLLSLRDGQADPENADGQADPAPGSQ